MSNKLIFRVRHKRCAVGIVNDKIVCHLENRPNYPIKAIPISEVIAVRPCFCKRPSQKKLSCECITEDLNLPSVSNGSWSNKSAERMGSAGSAVSTSSGSNAAESEHDSLSSNPFGRIGMIRLYYAKPTGRYGWKLSYLAMTPVEEVTEPQLCDFINAIRIQIEGLEPRRPKRVLIFVNPYGGKGLAPKIYTEKVAPLLQLAGVEVDCVVTQRANHAKDMIEDVDFCVKNYDGILCVGGDGMFAELLNGILVRINRQAGVDVNTPQSELVSPSVILGVIPAGSTDAVAYGVTGCNDPVTSTIHIMFGKKVNLDICSIFSVRDERLIRYATSFLGYGYFGDTLMESENYRWMGPPRYDFAGAKKIMGHQLYSGEIKLYMSPLDGSPKDKEQCKAGCQMCGKAAERIHSTTTVESPNKDEQVSCVTIRGRFLGINAATMSCRCGKTKKGISPSAHLGNGCTDLILFDLDFVDVYRVREFEFIPISSAGTSPNPPGGSSGKYQVSDTSVWNCDGEIINEPAIHVKVNCQLVSVFGPGVEERHRREKHARDAEHQKVSSKPSSDSKSSNRSLKKREHRKLRRQNPIVTTDDLEPEEIMAKQEIAMAQSSTQTSITCAIEAKTNGMSANQMDNNQVAT